ncbi:MAG: hypothetical protein VB858_20145, partial [Planctomycetaceae bacterium]
AAHLDRDIERIATQMRTRWTGRQQPMPGPQRKTTGRGRIGPAYLNLSAGECVVCRIITIGGADAMRETGLAGTPSITCVDLPSLESPIRLSSGLKREPITPASSTITPASSICRECISGVAMEIRSGSMSKLASRVHIRDPI